MATHVDQSRYGWSHEELPDRDRDDSQELSISHMLDHGSISFGRFAVESLSWEKRSVFTYNKHQEELEKFRNPGLVARKKAYFEEYYKKVRTLKALQENQQNELILDYGGDGSISSQAGEEEETVGQLESFGNGAANGHDVLPERNHIQPATEKEKMSIKSPQIGQYNQEARLSCQPSSTICSNEVGEKNYAGDRQIQQLAHVSLPSSELNVQYDMIDLEVSSRKYQSSMSDVVPEVAGQETDMAEIGTQETAASSSNSKPEEGHIPASNFLPNKHKHMIRQYGDHAAVSGVKAEINVSVRNGLKLGNNTKSDKAKMLQGAKHPVKMTDGKLEKHIGSSSSNATSGKIFTNTKTTSTASHRPLMEVRANFTTPRPFSLATERRAPVTPGNKEITKSSDTKTPSKFSSSLNHGKGGIHLPGSSKLTVSASAVKSKGQENKSFRGHECLALDRKSSKGTGVLAVGQPKARSINLPANDKANPSSRISCRIGVAVGLNNHKENKDSRPRETCTVGTKITALNVNVRAGSEKASPSMSNNSPLDGKKPLLNGPSGLPLDGRKPRREMPRWR